MVQLLYWLTPFVDIHLGFDNIMLQGGFLCHWFTQTKIAWDVTNV